MSDMGTVQTRRQFIPGQTPIVAFDFDGTLTVRDSFTAFLRWRAGRRGWAKGMLSLAPAVATYARDHDRGRIKAASVRTFLKAVPRATLEADAEAFAAKAWDGFMRPDALACWNDWGVRGAHRVIVTASPDTTVAPFARRLNADALFGTKLVFDEQDRVTGGFAGPN
ncbi:HAD-IB family phosphatase, partial [Brevundimonas sp.]|uniref:HAD-IB family phosphatase n=1 Tax=Brevundimonas sp. TaxID=1871086 RepID=UPI003568B41E